MPGGGIFAYVSNEHSRDIFVLQLDPESGAVTVVEKVAVNGRVMPMAVSPNRRFLYASLRSEPFSIASFAINPLTGRLTHLGNAPLPDSMVNISVDRTGRFLFGASSIPEIRPPNSLISVSAIGPYGFVQPAHQIVRTESKMHAILADPANRYVFATSVDADLVLRQVFDATRGLFSPNSLPPVRVKSKAGPRHFVFHPNNRFMYLLNEHDASVYAFEYDAELGGLREIQIVSAVPPDYDVEQIPHAADLHLTPDGRFLYASERISHTLAAFKVDLASGTLAPVGSFATEKKPRGFNIDPFGRYLLAVGELTHRMSVYAIDRQSGHLKKVSESPMGEGPNWVEIVNLP